VVAAGLALACLILLVDDVRLRRREAGAEGPHVGHLWRQLASNGLPTQVVLSDAGLAQLSDALGRAVTLGEYRKASYPFALSERLAFDPRAKAMVEQAAVKGLTAPQDARVAADVATLVQRHGAAAHVVSSRNVQIELGARQNLVLLGSRRANPWMEMFEAQLPFRYEFDEAHRTATVTHAAAAPARPAVYRVEWGRKSYVVVAFVPKPRGDGNVLLVYAADFLATAAAGQFLADEQGLAQLYARLGTAPSGTLPHFAALLRADLAGHAATNYELIEAGRVATPGT